VLAQQRAGVPGAAERGVEQHRSLRLQRGREQGQHPVDHDRNVP
jgi:hypothetical protein